MAKPIVLQPGSRTAVGSGLAVAKVLWAEPPGNGGTARVYDAAGNTIATLFYGGRGKGLPEPQAVNFPTPVAVQGGAVHATAPGGHLLVYIQGSSSSGG